MSVDFPGAVFPHDAVNGTRPHAELDPVQGMDAREALVDALHLKDELAHCALAPWRVRRMRTRGAGWAGPCRDLAYFMYCL